MPDWHHKRRAGEKASGTGRGRTRPQATLGGRALLPFDPGGNYLLIFNLGDRPSIFQKRRFLFGGRLAFIIKDRLDRNFMRKFQAIE